MEFTLTEPREKKIVMWDCHVYEYAKGRYNMIWGRYILTKVELNLKFSYHIIEVEYGPLKGLTAPLVDMGMYGYKNISTGKITTK